MTFPLDTCPHAPLGGAAGSACPTVATRPTRSSIAPASGRLQPHGHRRVPGPVLCAVLLALAGPAASAVQYELSVIEAPAGFSSLVGRGLNGAGDVVGSAFIGSGPGAAEHAFAWRAGSFVDLGAQAIGSRAHAINDAGLIVGSHNGQAVQWLPGQTTPQVFGNLATLPGAAQAVNSAGVVLGNRSHARGGLISTDGVAFGPAGASVLVSSAFIDGVSAPGAGGQTFFVGVREVDGGGVRAFRGSGAQLQPLATLTGPASTNSAAQTTRPLAVNSTGTVAGLSFDAAGRQRAVVWDANGQIRNLGSFGVFDDPRSSAAPVDRSSATAINEAGVVVGSSSSSASGSTAFLWTQRAGLQALPLANPQALPRGLALQTAQAINAHGQILVQTSQGAALLTPTGSLNWAGPGNGRFADATRWAGAQVAGTGSTPFDFGQAPTRFIDAGLPSRPQGTADADPALNRVVTLDGPAEVRGLSLGSGGNRSRTDRIELRLAPVAGSPQPPELVAGNGVRVFNEGVLSGQGTVRANLTVLRDSQGAGRVQASAGGTLAIVGQNHSNHGVLTAEATGARLQVAGNFTNEADGVVSAGSAVSLPGGAGRGEAAFLGPVLNLGSLRAGSGGTLSFEGAVVNRGSITAAAGGTVNFGGSVSGDGSFSGPGVFVFRGGLRPGNSPASIEIGEAVFEGGEIVMELGGAEPGSQHDQIRFTGPVSFGAGVALKVDILPRLNLAGGDRFQLFSFAPGAVPAAGGLDLSQLPVLGQGLRWDTSGIYSGGWLGVAAVPEPSTWLLCALGLVAVGLRSRNGGRR